MLIFTIKLLIAHFLGDFALQPYSWIKDKQKKKHKSKFLYIHIAIHLALLVIVLGFDLDYWPYVLFVTISHLLIDMAKLNLQTKQTRRRLFFIDQALHLLMIAIVICFEFQVEFNFIEDYSKFILLSILALIMLVPVSSIVIMTLMSRWDIDNIPSERGLIKAGAYIGVLERLFIFVFIVFGQWAAIGFLITAKSVFRFGDLSRARDRKLTEYILIGTLFSFLLAICTGLAFNFLLSV